MDNKKANLRYILVFLAMILTAALVMSAVTFIDTAQFSPANLTYTNNDTPAFSFNATSTTNETMNCTLLINGTYEGDYVSATNHTTATINRGTPLDQGAYNWTINCTDTDGSTLSGSSTITIDTVAPAVVITTGDLNVSTAPSINFTLDDALSPNATCTLYYGSSLYNTSVIANGSGTLTPNAIVPDGDYDVNVSCIDLANNTNTSTHINIKVDLSTPTVKLLNASFNTTSTTPSVTFNYTDAGAAFADCSLYFDGVSVGNNASVSNNTNTVLTASTQTEGIYSVYVNCTDDLSNIGKSATTIELKIDNTTPAVTISSPLAGAIVYDNTTDIVFSFTDSLSLTASCKVIANGTAYGTNASTLNNTATTIPINATTGLAAGNYSLLVNCTDDVSNIGSSASQSLIIDRTAPSITGISSSGADSTTTTGTLTVTATTDENATCWRSSADFNATNVTGAPVMAGTDTAHTFTVEYTADGTLGPYYVSCMDAVGNNMTTSNSTGSISVTVTEAHSGGGGGGIAYNPSTSQTWTQLTPGAASIMKISSDDFGVKQITIEVNNPAQNVKISIEKLSGKPASVTKEASGKIFRYLSISKQNLASNDIKGNVKIRFHVTKGWLSSNGVPEDDIVLMHYVDGSWIELYTNKLSSDGLYAYYEAETPDLSYFAIAMKEPVSLPKPIPASVTPPAETPAEEQPPTPEVKTAAKSVWIILAPIIIVLLLVLAVVLLVIRKKKPVPAN